MDSNQSQETPQRVPLHPRWRNEDEYEAQLAIEAKKSAQLNEHYRKTGQDRKIHWPLSKYLRKI